MNVRGLRVRGVASGPDRNHGGADMAQVRSWAGLDVHRAKVVAATIDRESGELRVRAAAGRDERGRRVLRGLAGPDAGGL